MPDLKLIKQKACQTIDMAAAEIIAVSHDIHSHPETGMNERYACKRLTDSLAGHGYANIQRCAGGIETAFRADYQAKKSGPRIAILAEYDALEGLGHGCGHNIITAAAFGAAIAMRSVLNETGGSVAIIGTPAEETRGGKNDLLEAGVFADCDFAMMIHPSTGNSIVGRGALACTDVAFAFYGKPAHSAAEELGVNALTACIETFNNVSAIRPSFKSGQKLNGVITGCDSASNVIPGYARALFCVRAKTLDDLATLIERVVTCAKSACSVVGTKVEIERGSMFAERYSNHVMDEAFRLNMETLGETMYYPNTGEFEGSSDIGNVSMKLPTIHEYISVAPQNVNTHSKELVKAACSSRGDDVCILGAKGLATTACDILLSSELQTEITEEFKKTVLAN